jgi:hypothetical protein
MAKSLFDHIKAITTEQNPNYWETLDDGDKKTWSNYMIHRFLSMNPDWIQVLSEIQPYTQVLEPKHLSCPNWIDSKRKVLSKIYQR